MIVIKLLGTFFKRITAGAVSAVLGLSCLSWSSPQRIDAAASAADQWIFREANDAAAYTDRVDGETIHLDWEGTPLRGIISKEYYSDYQMSAQIKKDSDSPWTSIQLGIPCDDRLDMWENLNDGDLIGGTGLQIAVSDSSAVVGLVNGAANTDTTQVVVPLEADTTSDYTNVEVTSAGNVFTIVIGSQHIATVTLDESSITYGSMELRRELQNGVFVQAFADSGVAYYTSGRITANGTDTYFSDKAVAVDGTFGFSTRAQSFWVRNVSVTELTSGAVRGDILQDGAVNGFDLAMLKKYMNGTAELTAIQKIAADCDQDGTVDQNDVRSLNQFLLTGKFITVSSAEYADSFTVSKVFSSDMVVQRGENLRIWGWADASENGKKISAEFKGLYAEGIVTDGQWTITFDRTLEADASMGNTMRVYTDTQSVQFENVLVGDVYMVIGQSNVHYSVSTNQIVFGNSADKGGTSTIDENAPIRINRNTIFETEGYPTRGTDEVCEDVVHDRGWQRATIENIAEFSAIGYYTAYHLLSLTGNEVPVGVIEIDGDGRPLGAFMPNLVAEQCGTDTYNGSWYTTTGVNGDRARFMYNHYMYPFERYALAGIFWYQGESDYESGNAEVYAEHFTTLMNYMRATHNLTNSNFPVYIMELPTIYKNNHNIDNWQYMDLGKIRAAIGEIPQMLSNSYLSVSSDFWSNDTYWNNLHPDIKFEQSARLAKLVASVGYGKMSLDAATGPVFDSIGYSADGTSAVIRFKSIGGGLSTSDGGSAVRGFVGFDSFGSGVTALDAVITSSDTITVSSSGTLPRYIAYNAVDENFYGNQINLCNSNGNPAAAFLCDRESTGRVNGISDYPAASIDDGVYYLRNANSGKYLDVSANSGTDGTNIQQWEFIGGNAQKFKFVSDGDGYYTIYTGSTRFNGCVDVDYGSVQNGTNIQQWAASGADNQKFRLVKTGDTYVITTKSTNGSSCLDVSDYSLENGANVHQWFFLDTANQKWYLEPAPAELDPDTASTGNGLDITNKTDLVSICYSVWFDGILGTGTEPVTDFNNITEVLEGKRDWGGEYSFHYWAKPAQGYYRSTDKAAARNNLQLLGDAGVDFIILDFTNMADSDYVDDINKGEAWAYQPVQTLCETIVEMRAEGKTVPYIALWCAQTDGRFIQELYNRFYTQEKWEDCFVYWDNKPFMIFKQGETFPHPDLFTVRYMWGLTGEHCWRFLNTNNQGTAYVNNGVPEQLSVAAAAQESYMSMTNTAHGRNHGIFFYEQWTEAFNVHPKIVTLTWWNEWAAQRFIINGESHFVDNYNKDYSRDIEPMEGGHGDQYYQWMKQYIAAYKSGAECPRLVEAGY